jgi:hypothetical protein
MDNIPTPTPTATEPSSIPPPILTSKWEHRRKFHRQDFGQVCERCDSTDVRGGGFDEMGKRRFKCNNCRSCWAN